MMNFYRKKLLLILSILLVLLVSACVPASMQKKAVCGSNQAFNNITRTCNSITVTKAAPVGTLNTLSMNQETSKLVTLSYTDINADAAVSCNVTVPGVAPQIEAISPILFSGELFSNFDLLYTAVTNLQTAISAANTASGGTYATDLTNINAYIVSINTTYRNGIKKSFVHQTILNNIALLNTASANILVSSVNAYNANIYPNVITAYAQVQSKIAMMKTQTDFMTNHCVCAGGVCSTYLVSKMRMNGSSGFNYTVTDKDGVSSTKSVSVAIAQAALATTPDYAPVALGRSTIFDFLESATDYATGTPVAQRTFQLPQVFGDYVINNSYTFSVTTTPTHGGITCSSTGSCIYTPTSGNDNSSSPTILANAATASGLTGGITFNARAVGTQGNTIQVNFYDLSANNTYVDAKSSPVENFGLVNGSAQEGYIRVVGTSINLFVNPLYTSVNDIVNLVNNDPKASILVTASGASAVAIAAVPAAVTLTGGLDNFDKFSYKVNNGSVDSAAVDFLIHITPTDDPPFEITAGAISTNPTALVEDVASFTVDLTSTYGDVDSTVADCRLDPLLDTNTGVTGSFTQVGVTPICQCAAGVCSLTLKPNIDVSGTFSFKYQILSGAANWSAAITRSITLNPVNDFPFITRSVYTVTEFSAAAAAPAVTTLVQNSAVFDGSTPPVLVLTAGLPAPASTTTVVGTAIITANLTAIAMKESTAIAEQSATYVITTFAGGGAGKTATEASQTVSLVSAVSDNTTLITPTLDSTTNTITLKPELYQVGTATITITVKDTGSVSATYGGQDTSTQKIILTVTPVSDYPYFKTTSACNFNKRTNTVAYCKQQIDLPPAAMTTINCVGISSPVGLVTPSLSSSASVPLYYYDAANSRCYKSTGTSDSSWQDVDVPPSMVETNEGGEAQIAFTIDEDMGATTTNNDGYIKIVSMTSDNTSLLPDANITMFYDLNDNGKKDLLPDSEVRAVGATLEKTISTDSALHKLFVKLKPIGGISGNANVVLKVQYYKSDGTAGLATSKSYSLIVHPIAALHGGWASISGSGIKTEKNGAPVNIVDMQCNYNKTSDVFACKDANGLRQDCVSDGSSPHVNNPHSYITPEAANTIFWDKDNKKCYRAQGPPTDKFSWLEMNTSCPISRFTATTCPISQPTWNTATVPTATQSGEYYYNPTTKICYISSAAGTGAWYAAPANWIVTAATLPSPTAIGQYSYATDTKTCYISTTIDSGTAVTNRWTAYLPSKINLSWNAFNLSGTGSDASVQITGWNVYRREINEEYNFIDGFLTDSNSSTLMTITNPVTRSFTDTTAIAGRVYFYTVRPVDSNHKYGTYTPEVFSEVRVLAPPDNYAFVHRWTVNQEICNSMNMTTATTNKVDPLHNYRCPYIGPGEKIDTVTLNHYYDYGRDLLVDISEMGCPYTQAPTCSNNGCIGIGVPGSSTSTITGTPATGSIYYDRSAGTCYEFSAGSVWVKYAGTVLAAATPPKLNSALNPPLTNITPAQAIAACSNRPVLSYSNVTIDAIQLPEKRDYMAYSPAPMGMTDSAISDLEQGYSLDVQSRCNGSSASGIDQGYTDSTIPSSTYMYSMSGTATSGIRSMITGSTPLTGITASTESCVSRYGIQDIYGNVSEWVKDSMICYPAIMAVGDTKFPYTCKATNGTSMGLFNFGTVTNSGTPGMPGTYGFDGVTGPFYDKNATIQGPDAADAYITEWSFVDRLFSAGYISFPLGIPVHTDHASNIQYTAFSHLPTTTSGLSEPTLLDIGPGITAYQLHGDGIIVNGASMLTTGDKTGYFAVGGSYLSGLRAGRFTMELVPEATATRPDIGFRCVAPISNYTNDSAHPYTSHYLTDY